MGSIETFFGLLLAALIIALAAKRIDQPYPIALVLAGLAIALFPGLPRLQLDPQWVFYLFLPPILGEAAYFTSWTDFLRWKRPILLLAFGLVSATSAAVAAICVWTIPGFTWASGFLLGAIVSPPDAAAATAITRGLGMPRRIVQIIEGESLVNDAAALVLYRFSLAAVLTGTFSWSQAGWTLLWVIAGGAAIGSALGFLYVRLFPKLKDAEVEILSTFLLSYVSYFAAEAVHASGVLSTVAAGLILGWNAPSMFTATTRIRATAVWRTVIFLINALVFLLIGLQLPEMMASLHSAAPGALLLQAALVVGTVIIVRLLWVYPGAYVPRLLSARIRRLETKPPLSWVFVTGWTGLRGVVSLASALALPFTLPSGAPFPQRDLILFLTFAVILGTLIFQGLTLRPIIRTFCVLERQSSEVEVLRARAVGAERVLEYLLTPSNTSGVPAAALDRVRGYFEDRIVTLRTQLAVETRQDVVDQPGNFASLAEQKLWWESARLERQAAIDMRRSSQIGDEAMRQIEYDIDLLEARLVPKPLGH